MRTISLVCQKGGTGKTTLALSLATEALRRDCTAAIIDLDPQVSACEWSDLRGRDTPAVIDAQPARIDPVVARARQTGVDLLLVDTAGRTEQSALAAARVADLALMPLQASAVDLKTVRASLDLVELAGAARRAAVLTRVKPFGARHAETADWLGQLGLPVCPVTIGDRIAFQDAYSHGLGVCELEPQGKAALEIRHLYEYTCELLNK